MATDDPHACRTSVGTPLVERAHVYVISGWALVPLLPRSKEPHRGLLGDLYGDTRLDHLKVAPALPVEVEWWFVNEDDINIGIFPGGTSGLVICDLDHLDVLDLALPTPTVSSGREAGGKHLYFHSDESVAMKKTVWGHINPAYAVAPGSTHPSGRTYEWLPGLSPEEVPLMDFADARSLLALPA
jgi:hypothetical protein